MFWTVGCKKTNQSKAILIFRESESEVNVRCMTMLISIVFFLRLYWNVKAPKCLLMCNIYCMIVETWDNGKQNWYRLCAARLSFNPHCQRSGVGRFPPLCLPRCCHWGAPKPEILKFYKEALNARQHKQVLEREAKILLQANKLCIIAIALMSK